MSKSLRKKAFILSVFTVGYNVVEGIISITAGLLSGSIALQGFGVDSFIESISGSIMIWRFKRYDSISKKEEEKVEKIAQRLVAVSFFILSVYIVYESVSKLILQEVTRPSILGLAIVVTSTIVMPILYFLKYRTGKRLGSKSLVADSKETLACLFLSISVLIGILLNLLFGFWQADPIIGILIAIYLVVEGIRVLKE